MKHLKIFLIPILIGTLLIACNESDVVTKTNKPNDHFQNLTSLEGTVWVHHPDTDPESENWFNIWHNPKIGADTVDDFSYPAEISFLANGVVNEPTSDEKLKTPHPPYYYSYDEPYITVCMGVTDDCKSVEEWQKKYNLCHLTIDNWKCDSLKCKSSAPNSDIRYGCISRYRFLGKVEGDTMHLQMITIISEHPRYGDTIFVNRNVHLVRKK
jgi:hypothetical protein